MHHVAVIEIRARNSKTCLWKYFVVYPSCKSFSWANNAFIEIQNYSQFLGKKYFVSKLILAIGHKELFYSIGKYQWCYHLYPLEYDILFHFFMHPNFMWFSIHCSHEYPKTLLLIVNYLVLSFGLKIWAMTYVLDI